MDATERVPPIEQQVENTRPKSVFEPYFTTKPSGTGLGLLIVRRIVREHGGELSIESGQGKGLTLTIRLPYIDKRIRMLEAGETKSAG